MVNGDADRMLPSSNSYDLAQRLPNATLRIYPDAGHGGIFQAHDGSYPKRSRSWDRRLHDFARRSGSAGQGANRGMGRDYAAQLLDRGVTKVYAAARDPRTIDVLDPRVVPLQLDVTDPTSVAEAAGAALTSAF